MLQVRHYSSSSYASQGNVFLSGPEENNDQVQLPSHMKHLEQYTQVLILGSSYPFHNKYFTVNTAVKLSFGEDKTSFEAKVMYVLCCWTSSCYWVAERLTHKLTTGCEPK